MSALTPAALGLLGEARRAVLGTVTADGRARLVPVCYWLAEQPDAAGRARIYSALDEKPKRSAEPLQLARVRDLLVRPAVTLLADRWDEDWRQLAWVRVDGLAAIVPAPPSSNAAGGDADLATEHAQAVAGLRARYPQYRRQDLAVRPLIRITVEAVAAWQAA